MIYIQAGYRAYTGHIFTQVQADSYNAASEKAERNPTDANLNGAHNLFRTIAETPSLISQGTRK